MQHPQDRSKPTTGPAGGVDTATEVPPRLAYEPPRLLKRQEVRRVTLFSGGGVVAVGLTASG